MLQLPSLEKLRTLCIEEPLLNFEVSLMEVTHAEDANQKTKKLHIQYLLTPVGECGFPKSANFGGEFKPRVSNTLETVS